MNKHINHKKGFTLIELLLVVVIIGILAGIVIAIINPARMQRRSRESVMLSNVEKVCIAIFSCGSASGAVTSCDDATGAEAGVNLAQLNNGATNATRVATSVPPFAFYGIGSAGNVITVTGNLPGSAAAGGNGALGTAACNMTCTYDFGTGLSGAIAKDAGCY